ncbi:MAG: serine/threonine protein kinase [Myxococcales bacterium]|nr:serine/threonine protein kinase [Myxococcales bacterium]
MLICPTCLKQRPFAASEPKPVCPDDGSALLQELDTYSSTPDVVVGHVVGGRYLVERVLGEGGMGLVLAGRHLALGRRAAVKLLHPSLASLPEIRARFLREARAAAELGDPDKRDPRIVTVNDFGETSNGMLYLVMELLSGVDLFTWSTVRGASTWRDVAWLGIRIADALSVMHRRGYVHRDLKPENVWIGDPVDGAAESLDVKLLDFGVVGLLDAPEDRRLTRAGTTVGTPTYMAPEQIRGEPVDERADLYALACVLWELETGHPPFRAKTPAEIFSHHLYESVPSLRAASPDVPRWLANLLESCLAKDRSRRPASADEVARQLREGLAIPKVDRDALAVSAPTAPTLDTPRPRNRTWLWGGALLAAVAWGTIAIKRLSTGESSENAAAAEDAPRPLVTTPPSPPLEPAAPPELSPMPVVAALSVEPPSAAEPARVVLSATTAAAAPRGPEMRVIDESSRYERRDYDLSFSKRPAKTGPKIQPPKVDDGLMEPR